MEVGLPLLGDCDKDPSSATLEDDFYKVRREGAQNHSPSEHPVLCFHQKDSLPDVMQDESILQKFVINESACATRVSTKNFQLVKSRASRSNMLSPSGDGDQMPVNEDEVLLQMGKLDDNVFSCAYKAPFTFLQTFMICLSRFETKQAY